MRTGYRYGYGRSRMDKRAAIGTGALILGAAGIAAAFGGGGTWIGHNMGYRTGYEDAQADMAAAKGNLLPWMLLGGAGIAGGAWYLNKKKQEEAARRRMQRRQAQAFGDEQ